MEKLFDLDVDIDMNLDEMVESKEYLEFTYDLKVLDDLYVDPFTEKMVDNNVSVKKKVGGVISNTADTTGDVVKAYNNITDANAKLIKNTWDLMMSGAKIIVKMSTFIINNIAKVPAFIVKTGEKVANVSQDVKNKIQGNITLYITAEDIQALYNKSLLDRLRSFMEYAQELSKGTTWNMTLGLHYNKNDIVKVKIAPHDVDLCNKMSKVYKGLENIKFSPTTVEMKTESAINLYFGNEKSITYTYQGHSYQSNYYDALKNLMDILAKERTAIQAIQDSIKVKVSEASNNQPALAKFDFSAHKTINEAVQQVAKITGVVGNITNCIIKDMKTIQDAANSIISKSNKTVEKSTKA